MTGRSVHDALLRILCEGTLRARLVKGGPCPRELPTAEWDVLTRLSLERLQRLSRFLAHHYYRERIVRLFRHIRTLVPHTGRDPMAILRTPEAHTIMDQGALGSTHSAERILALIETFLLADDAGILEKIPYWRDLVRYQAAMFLAESAGGAVSCRNPCRSTGARIVDLQWDVPAVLTQLRNATADLPYTEPTPTSLLVACSRRGQVSTVRCTKDIRLLVESSNGARDINELSRIAGLPIQQTEQLLRQMEEVGAVEWDAR